MHRICVIYNPTAKGEKARRFRQRLVEIGDACAFKQTQAPGDASRLAAEAVKEGYLDIVAAGGDGTVNEVLNGIAMNPTSLDRVRMGVLPLGTVNVFARELRIPGDLKTAWEVVLHGRTRSIDLPLASVPNSAGLPGRYFAQLAGAGLDARAIELVSYPLKRKIGPMAYVFAGLKALTQRNRPIRVEVDGTTLEGALILVGNGRLYGGDYQVFPEADMNDGLLDVCVFRRVNWLVLAHCGPHLLIRGRLPASAVSFLRGRSVQLESDWPIPFEVDGEWAGRLPVRFGFAEQRLGVIVP